MLGAPRHVTCNQVEVHHPSSSQLPRWRTIWIESCDTPEVPQRVVEPRKRYSKPQKDRKVLKKDPAKTVVSHMSSFIYVVL